MSNLKSDMTNRFINYIKNNTRFKHFSNDEKFINNRDPINVTFFDGIQLRCSSTLEYTLRISFEEKQLVYFRKDKQLTLISEEEFFQLSLLEDTLLSYENIKELIDIYLKNGYNRGFSIRMKIFKMEKGNILL